MVGTSDFVAKVAIGVPNDSNGSYIANSFVQYLKSSQRISAVEPIRVCNTKQQLDNEISKGCDLVICIEKMGDDAIGKGSVEEWLRIEPRLRVIVIVGDNRVGGAKLKSLYSINYYNAIYMKDCAFGNVEQLILNGRTAEDAASYYGIEEFVRSNHPDIQGYVPNSYDTQTGQPIGQANTASPSYVEQPVVSDVPQTPIAPTPVSQPAYVPQQVEMPSQVVAPVMPAQNFESSGQGLDLRKDTNMGDGRMNNMPYGNGQFVPQQPMQPQQPAQSFSLTRRTQMVAYEVSVANCITDNVIIIRSDEGVFQGIANDLNGKEAILIIKG